MTAAWNPIRLEPATRILEITLWLFLALVAIADVATPPTFTASVLYIFPVILAAALRLRPPTILFLSIAAASLLVGITVPELLMYEYPLPNILNRTIHLIVLGLSALLSRHWQTRMDQEQALRAQIGSEREILGDALKAIPAGVAVCFDPTLDRIIGNERLYELFRIPPNQGISFAPDRPTAFWFEQKGSTSHLSFTPLHQAMLKGEVCDNQELELVFPDGVRKTIMASARPLFSQARLVGAVASVLDITERQNLENRLREALSMRDRFLAVVGHELRNPLTPILGWTEVLKKDASLNESLRRAILSIERNTLQLSTLVHDLLDLSRIQNHKLEITRTHVDLRGVVEQAVDSMLKAASQRQLMLRFESDAATPCFAFADTQRLHQVLLNLIDNAIKFTPPGGSVTVRLQATSDRATIVVQDSGIGIPASFLPKLFEIFSQSEDLPSKRRRGLGIGLSLVKSIVTMHGGTVSAESEGEGRGAKFIVSLPRAGSTALPSGPRTVESPNLRCIIIDDEEETLFTLQAMLESLGYQVDTATDGAAGIQKALAQPPDLILCDLSMPTLDGYGVLRQARINPRLAGIPIVAISGLGMPEDRQRTREAGFAAHLTKPVSLDVLESTLREAVTVKI
jgi:signal transduction histidine kinase/CheY-like chemotaxis protein